MNKFKIDTHIHTLACGHGYSTIKEIAEEASKKDLEIICITEHVCYVENAFFNNIIELPKTIEGVRVLKGAEIDIKSFEGDVTLREKHFRKLDFFIASLHKKVLLPGSLEQNTKAFINAMKKYPINVLGHIDNPDYPINFNKVIKFAKENNVAIEINNGSFLKNRGRSIEKDRMRKIIKICLENNAYISLGSDAHNAYQVGDFSNIIKLIEEVDYPKDLIINSSVDNFNNFIKLARKKMINV